MTDTNVRTTMARIESQGTVKLNKLKRFQLNFSSRTTTRIKSLLDSFQRRSEHVDITLNFQNRFLNSMNDAQKWFFLFLIDLSTFWIFTDLFSTHFTISISIKNIFINIHRMDHCWNRLKKINKYFHSMIHRIVLPRLLTLKMKFLIDHDGIQSLHFVQIVKEVHRVTCKIENSRQ